MTFEEMMETYFCVVRCTNDNDEYEYFVRKGEERWDIYRCSRNNQMIDTGRMVTRQEILVLENEYTASLCVCKLEG